MLLLIMKIYYVYKFTGNPDPVATCERLKEIFGGGYIFDEAHPDAGEMTREEIRELFTREMTGGGFDKVIVDISRGLGRFMKEEIALAEELGIQVEKIDLRELYVT